MSKNSGNFLGTNVFDRAERRRQHSGDRGQNKKLQVA